MDTDNNRIRRWTEETTRMDTWPLRIVVVDDNELVADAISATLEFEGFRSFPAHSGLEGIAKCRQHDVHAILLDISMPQCDGFATCRQIRSSTTLRKILIIAYTALPPDFVFAHSIPGDFDGYCQKGIPADELAMFVASWFGG